MATDLRPFTGNLDQQDGLAPFSGELDTPGMGFGARPKPRSPGLGRSVADSALALGKGVVSGAQMLTNVAGADNRVSQSLGRAAQSLGDLESDQRKAERAARGETIRRAEESGSTWEEVKAYGGAFLEAPIDTTLEALGTSLPTLAGAALTGGASVPAAIAARALPAALGAAQGVGAVKGAVHDAVQQQHLDAGATPEQAAACAAQAQAYSGDNAASIATGGALGALAGSTGAESVISKLARRRAAQQAANEAAQGVGRAAVSGAVREAPAEMLQGGHERLASNLAVQREGFDTPTMQGVVGQAVLEGLAGGVMGGGIGALGARGQRPAAGPAPADHPLLLENRADPLLVFPDSTIARQSDFDRYIESLPEDQRAAARARAYGYGSQDVVPTAAELQAEQDAAIARGEAALASQIRQQVLEDEEGGEYFEPESTRGRERSMLPNPQPDAEQLQGAELVPQADAAVDEIAASTGADRQETRGALPPVTSTTLTGETPGGLVREQMRQRAALRAGIDPSAGPLSAAAASALDAGAPTQLQQALMRIRAEKADVRQTQTPNTETAQADAAGLEASAPMGGDGATAAGVPAAGAAGAAPTGLTPAPATPENRTDVAQAPEAQQATPQGPAPQPATPVGQAVAEIANDAATSPANDRPEPTQAQKEAGNYKKAHLQFDGLDLTIENPVGSTRSGTDPNGKPWSVDMTAHYGYVKRSMGADGDQVDVYLAPDPLPGSPVFVFDQFNADGTFDEHKAVAGVATQAEAEAIYDAHFSDGSGPRRRRGVKAMTPAEFKAWASEDAARGPVAPAAKSTKSDKQQISGARRMRLAAWQANPLRAFLGEHGIHSDLAAEFAPGAAERRKAMVPGFGPIFRRSGKQLDELATLARDAGFMVDDDAAELHALVERVMRGERVAPLYAEGVAERQMEQAMQARYEDFVEQAQAEQADDPLAPLLETGFTEDDLEATGLSDANAELIAEVRALHAQLDAAGLNPEDMLERFALQFPDLTQDQFNEQLQNAYRQAVAQATEPSRIQSTGGAATRQAQPAGAGSQGQDGLTSYTRDDLAQRQAQRDAATTQQETERKAADQRAAADAQRDEFTLTGSDRAADANPAQGDLLAASTAVPDRAPAAAPRPAPVSARERGSTARIEDLGEKIGGARKDTAASGYRGAKRYGQEQDERPAWARRYQISQIAAGNEEGRWVVRDGRSLNFMKQPKQVGGTFATREEAEAFLPMAAVALKHRVVPAGEGKWEIWRDVSDRKRVKVVDQTFTERAAAMEYMARHAAEIVETNTTFGEGDLPLPPDKARIGPQRRQGDVDGKDFREAFGFRGVEFGNWNNQDERQALMNDAYDALMDLSIVLNLPPKALSLNGELALAFGARGQGLSSARAHYETERVVINLTKEHGAGSLAHEWFHAMDHYFGRQDGKATAVWVQNADGTRSLKSGGTSDMVSHGFRRASNVRPELREAYDNLISTIFKKGTTYVEDTQKADNFVARAREDLARSLDALRSELSAQKDPKYYKRNNKPATAEQLAEFDAIAKRMLDGEAQAVATDWRVIAGVGKSRIASRWTNDAMEALGAIYKAVRGRSGFNPDRDGAIDRLRVLLNNYSQRLKMLADAQQGTKKVRMVPTDFAMAAKELDQGRGTDYWTTPHEMAARAFQGYVEDKVAEAGGVSRFLNFAPENAGILTPWGAKRPFPHGAERKAINAALERFVATLQTREDSDGNVAMLSRPMGDQTQTEAFRRWFGDSKVVDAYGKPLVMYHGTNKSEGGDAFTSFDTYGSNYGLMGQGSYFTAEPMVASEYTRKGRGGSPTVYPVYLSIKNPIDMDAKADPEAWIAQFPDAGVFHEGGDTNESWYRAAEDALRDAQVPAYEGAEAMQEGLRAMGYDGIKHIGGGRVKDSEVRHRVYIAFDPEQIKSATGNRGTFDPADANIANSRPMDSEMFRRMTTPLQPLSVQETRVAVAEMATAWKDRLQVKVVPTPADLPVDAPSDARGMYLKGTAYVVASNHRSAGAVQRTLAHEAIAHFGLRDMLGAIEWRRTMAAIQKGIEQGDAGLLELQADVRAAYRDDAGNFNLTPGQEADEIAARAVEVGFDATTGEFRTGWDWVKRAYSRILQFLRRVGINIAISNAELQGMLSRAQQHLRGERSELLVVGDLQPAGALARDRASGLDTAIIGNALGAATAHPRYAAAKAGDAAAAVEVAKALVTPELVAQVRAVIGDRKPLIVPVVAEEAAGRNKIPRAAAEALAQQLDLETADDISQLNRPRRTGLDGLERIFSRVEFDGPVVAGQDYLLLDDTLTQGGTFSALASHIEAGGGRVVGAVALTGKQYSAKIGLSPSTLQALRDKHGTLEPDFQAATGYGFDALTESEARYLANFKPADALRARIVEEGRRASQGGDSAPAGPDDVDAPALARGAPAMPMGLGNSGPRTADVFSDLSAGQRAFLNKIGTAPATTRIRDWLAAQTERLGTRIRQGLVDRYAALKELDEKLHGKDFIDAAITDSSWVLARMSSAGSGALQAMMTAGRIDFDRAQRVITLKAGDDSGGLTAVLRQLGTPAEVERFFGWMAANRADKLMGEGRENLFTAEEVAAGKQLNAGKLEDGRARLMVYAKVHREFQQYRDDVLAVAEQAGVVSAENREMWRDEFYVPFYRVMDEEAGTAGPRASKGLSRQEAFKKLKGGKDNLNDLLENTLMNFHHLLSASLKNQAATQAVRNAERLQLARRVSESRRDPKTSTFVLEGGRRVFYEVDDPLVFEALTALADPGLNNASVKLMSAFKRVFTNMTTVTPQFIVANTFRDLLQASATSPTSKNIARNLVEGAKTYRDQKTRAEMLASGGAFSFGHIYGMDADEVKASLQRSVKGAGLVSSTQAVPDLLRRGWKAWGEFADTSENLSRAATYAQNVGERGRLRAAFESRDIMDFSSHGTWPAVRFLIRVVPFLNARLQGLDKLYRAGVKPAVLTAMGKGTESDRIAAARFGAVTGALTLASLALYMVNADDDEYQKLEDWQKDTYWFFRIGDNAFFLPKPFEVGAIATMAERVAQQFLDDKATGAVFRERLGDMLWQTFSFNPVPQLFQPALDIYSNKDAFTKREIETAGMERLSPGLRTRDSTTVAGQAISAASRALGDETPFALSPVQADHLIRGYLGSVGASAAGILDTMYRAASGVESPDKAWTEYQPIRRFYRDLGAPAPYTRYSTLFYDGLREVNRVYADVRELQSLGRGEEAQALSAEKQSKLQMRVALNRQQRRLGDINRQMEQVRLADQDGAWKRRELDRLRTMKNAITEQYGRMVEAERASD